jgi:hypothetical protein
MYSLIASEFKGQMPVLRNPARMLFSVKACCNVAKTHCANTIFGAPRPVFYKVHASLCLLNALLNGPKTLTSSGCRRWLV